jgi:hypothetical protein
LSAFSTTMSFSFISAGMILPRTIAAVASFPWHQR